uniref:nicotinamidase n=1 Tax=Arion vulgaris TaxID=1028688 RepID=A0A0B6Y2M0_9EUPU
MSLFNRYSAEKFKDDQDSYASVFEYFDKNRDGFIDTEEFLDLLQDLLTSDTDLKLLLNNEDVIFLFSHLDLDNDGHISLNEFKSAWSHWFRQILNPVKALVIVDVQNDFITGSLSLCNCPAGQDGSTVIPVINTLLEQSLFDVIVYTHDWHPENHISFIDNVSRRNIHHTSKVLNDDVKLFDRVVFEIDGMPREQIMWPKHCVQGTWGSELHPGLMVVENAFHVKKGTNPDIDSYSAFWDNNKRFETELSSILRKQQVTDLYICGLAYDFCVGHTATHAVKHGFRTILIEDATRGVSLDGIAKMRSELITKGVYFTESHQVPKLKSELRPLCLAVQAAINYKLAWKMIQKSIS